MTGFERDGWKKAKPFRVCLPSGRICYLRRPSPASVLKTGKIQRLLSRVQLSAGITAEDAGWALIETLSDEEAEKMATQAFDLIIDVAVEPKFAREPKDDEFGIVDLGNDFWPLYFQAVGLLRDHPVQLQNGETTVAAVETFPREQITDTTTSDDGSEVQSPPC